MILKTKIQIIEPYSGKSKFPIWNKMQSGDVILVSLRLKNESGASSGMYVPNIKLYNETQNIEGSSPYNFFQGMLLKVNYKEIE